MNTNEQLLQILNKHIGTPQLHQQILKDYEGMYSLGIGKDWKTGEPNLVLAIPKEVEQEFSEYITLDNVSFHIVSDYSLKPITPMGKYIFN